MPQPEETPSERPLQKDPSDRLFRHKLRPDWGVGLWVKEERTRRRLQFEDGETRAFKKGFYHLLTPVDPDNVDAEEVFEALAGEHEILQAERKAAEARKNKPPVMSFKSQIKVFEHLYGGGFGGDDWKDGHRAPVETNRWKKAHVDRATGMAAETLEKAAFAARIQAGEFGPIHEDLCGILRSTKLVSPTRDCKPVEALDADKQKIFVEALFALLHSEDRYRDRFKGWLLALRNEVGIDPSWPLATAFHALLEPERHVLVKRRPLELQARSLKPGTALRKRPSARGYRVARRVARATSKKLTKKGHAPSDLLDAVMFSIQTLRPKSVELAKSKRW